MQLGANADHQKLLSEVIKKQIVILGPDITLAKARNVQGLTIADDGTVTAMTGDPQQLTQKLIEQFMELSGLIVKKTMEPLLAMQGDAATPPIPQAPQPTSPSIPAAIPPLQTPPAPAPMPSMPNPIPSTPPTTPATPQQPTMPNDSQSGPVSPSQGGPTAPADPDPKMPVISI